MENLKPPAAAALRLPPGFRFHPTDEELLLQYLLKKALSSPLPAAVHIPDAHVSRFNPRDLPGDLERERYFFSRNEARGATDFGYWKASGIEKRIVSSKENRLIGFKKTMVFYTRKPPNKTDWVMHRYRLATVAATAASEPPPYAMNRNWVLCRIFSKKRRSTRDEKKKNSSNICNDSIFHEILGTDLNLAPCSSSSGSSGVTQISVNNQEQEETSSCNSVRRR